MSLITCVVRPWDTTQTGSRRWPLRHCVAQTAALAARGELEGTWGKARCRSRELHLRCPFRRRCLVRPLRIAAARSAAALPPSATPRGVMRRASAGGPPACKSGGSDGPSSFRASTCRAFRSKTAPTTMRCRPARCRRRPPSHRCTMLRPPQLLRWPLHSRRHRCQWLPPRPRCQALAHRLRRPLCRPPSPRARRCTAPWLERHRRPTPTAPPLPHRRQNCGRRPPRRSPGPPPARRRRRSRRGRRRRKERKRSARACANRKSWRPPRAVLL